MSTRLAMKDPIDVTDILGLRTPVTRILVGAVVVAMAFGASQVLEGLSLRWPAVVVVVIMGAATVALITIPHDPLPHGVAIMIALAPPVASAILLSVVPVPLTTPNQAWVAGYTTLIYYFMCMRGRALLAWLSLAISGCVYGAWAAMTDQAIWDGASIPIYNTGALLAATLIAHAIRSTTTSILSLRAANAQRAADASAITAAHQERNIRLAELGELAQPALARIATGVQLSDAERLSCELLEAHLRDQLRARALAGPETAAATRAARARGVEVMLIDDGGLTGASELIKATVRREVAAALQSAEEGEVRARVMPPGRTKLATIYQHGESGTTRIEINALGHILKDTPAQRFPTTPRVPPTV